MNRQEVYKQIESTLGLVPQFFKLLPDSTLELEWQLMQRVQMDEGAIPNKYRELIGVGIAATTKCAYCIFFHTEMAKLHGATDAEIEDAVHFAKSSAGWSAYSERHAVRPGRSSRTRSGARSSSCAPRRAPRRCRRPAPSAWIGPSRAGMGERRRAWRPKP